MAGREVINSKGEALKEASIETFQDNLRGEVLESGDDGYNAARKVWNAMIDLAPMKSIRVNPVAQTVRAEPGVLGGELDRETQAFGPETPVGVVSTTGIAGLTLGGGGRVGLPASTALLSTTCSRWTS